MTDHHFWLPHFLRHSGGCNRKLTHQGTHIIIRIPQSYTDTHIPARSAFFHPVCSNPLLSTTVRDANKHTNKQSDERTWRLKLSFCFIFFFLSVPPCLAQCVRPRCSTLLYGETMGGQPHCQSRFIFPRVWSKLLHVCVCVCVGVCVCECVHVRVYMYVPTQSEFTLGMCETDIWTAVVYWF